MASAKHKAPAKKTTPCIKVPAKGRLRKNACKRRLHKHLQLLLI
jgi:hypothetical protein